MKHPMLFHGVILILALFSAQLTLAGPSTYTENAKKQTGKMIVAQFNYPGYGTIYAQMAPPAPGPGYQLEEGTVLAVSKIKKVKSTYAVPANYDSTEKRLFIPGLIVINQVGWSYYDVTLTANTPDVDSIGFPTELIVTKMVATQLGEPAPTPLPTSTPVPTPTLSCTVTATTTLTISAAGTGNVVAPSCPDGYVQTSTNCESSSWKMPFVYVKSGTCSASNNDTSSADLRASRTCCKVQ